MSPSIAPRAAASVCTTVAASLSELSDSSTALSCPRMRRTRLSSFSLSRVVCITYPALNRTPIQYRSPHLGALLREVDGGSLPRLDADGIWIERESRPPNQLEAEGALATVRDCPHGSSAGARRSRRPRARRRPLLLLRGDAADAIRPLPRLSYRQGRRLREHDLSASHGLL